MKKVINEFFNNIHLELASILEYMPIAQILVLKDIFSQMIQIII